MAARRSVAGRPASIASVRPPACCRRTSDGTSSTALAGPARPKDATDHNLPYLYWYALEPLVAEDPAKALKLAADGKIPMLLQFAARRVGALGTPRSLRACSPSRSRTRRPTSSVSRTSAGCRKPLKGKRNVPMPDGWVAAFEVLIEVAGRGRSQSGHGARGRLRRQERARRRFARCSRMRRPTPRRGSRRSTALVDARDAETAPLLQAAIADKDLRRRGIRGLAAFDDAEDARRDPRGIRQLHARREARRARDARGPRRLRQGTA